MQKSQTTLNITNDLTDVLGLMMRIYDIVVGAICESLFIFR